MIELTFLHTNDFHNHLTAIQAESIKRRKAEFENVLLVDSGDAISAGNVGVQPCGEPILTLMSETGYDAMTLGNREFHVADTLLRLKISKAKFPILCANMRWREDKGKILPTVPSLIKTLPNGLRVAIFGLTVPMVTPRMMARHVSAFVFNNPVMAAQTQIAHLRSESDVLIALTHIGLREDERLAAVCPDLDLIIGGHSHDKLFEPKVINGVPIVQAGWFGHYLGETRMIWDEHSKKLDVASRLVDIRDAA